MNAYEKIRAALNQADALIPDFSYLKTRNDEALSALAELEKASGRSSARMSWEICGCQTPPTHYVGTMPCPLNPTPPPVKPAQQFVAGEVGKRMLKNAYHRALNRIIEISERSGSNATIAEQAREWLDAWRSELGPALGMVEIREPSDDECRDIWREAKANDGDGSKVCAGRAMFDAVRAVLWPKEGL